MAARDTALSALIACRREGAWINEALKEAAARDRLDSRDAALAARLCYGVVQNRARLDFYLDQLLTGKKRNLHPVVRDILHLGLYQIYEMTRIPDTAAVNESVALAKKFCPRQPWASSLVNGVLRRAAETKGTLREPSSYAQKYSHPEELISLLKQSLPKGTLEGMLIADNSAPPTAVQVNLLRTETAKLVENLGKSGISAKPHPWMADCLLLENPGNLEHLPAFREGLFYVQDAASRLSVMCAGLRPGTRVLDCCAAPGGKSFAAAIAMEGRGEILSCDIHPHKIDLISAGAKRLGLSMIRPMLQDASQFRPEWESAFDAVMVDAPCSGLGIIRKKPDIRNKNLQETQALPNLQGKILENQARYVRPGGVLMYSTCTVLKRENQEVVRSFLGKHPDFYLEPMNLPRNIPETETGMLTLIPGQYDTDGFFICRLGRKP